MQSFGRWFAWGFLFDSGLSEWLMAGGWRGDQGYGFGIRAVTEFKPGGRWMAFTHTFIKLGEIGKIF